jgi:hypothetical protein
MRERVVGAAGRVWPRGRAMATRGWWRRQTKWKLGELDEWLKKVTMGMLHMRSGALYVSLVFVFFSLSSFFSLMISISQCSVQPG